MKKIEQFKNARVSSAPRIHGPFSALIGRFAFKFSAIYKTALHKTLAYQALCILGLVLCAFAAASSPALAKPGYAALAIDAGTGKTLHSSNPNALRHPASLTKIMTLYMLFGELNAGRMTYNTKLVITAHAAAQQPSKLGLKPGQTIRVIDAIRALVTKSANDVAVAVAENLGGTEANFARVMTLRARNMGMTRTVFRNASGLPNKQQVTTARDMVTLAKRMMQDYPKYYPFFKTRYFSYKGRRFRNHNKLLFNYKGTEGIKTGYTRASGFNLTTSVKRNKKHVIAVVLGGKTAKRRDAKMRTILTAALKKAKPVQRRRNDKPFLQLSERMPPPPGLPHSDVYIRPEDRTEPVAPRPQAAPRRKLAARQPARAQNYQLQSAQPRPAQPQPAQAQPARLQRPALAKPQIQNQAQPAVLQQAAPNPSAPQNNVHNQTITQLEAIQKIAPGPYHIQVGAFSSRSEAEARLTAVRNKASGLLEAHNPFTMPVPDQARPLVRARFAAFSRTKAKSVCKRLKRLSISCIPVPAQ